jgi:hypothetical protein
MKKHEHFGYITLFKNDRETAEGTNRPQYSGHVELPDGTKLMVSLWDKMGKNSGKPFMSGSIQRTIEGINTEAEKIKVTIPTASASVKSGSTYSASAPSGGGVDDLPF